jgi:putative Mg2+ transporter-C (MgtC) family protein
MTLLQITGAWDWGLFGTYSMKLGLAFLLAIPVGWEREKETHSAGVRTFPVVAMAACAFILTAQPAGSDTAAMSRVLQGITTGIGFIGGGAILREGVTVRGIATAASIWSVGALGAAVALGRYEIAVVLCILNLAALHLLRPLKKFLGGGAE